MERCRSEGQNFQPLKEVQRLEEEEIYSMYNKITSSDKIKIMFNFSDKERNTCIVTTLQTGRTGFDSRWCH